VRLRVGEDLYELSAVRTADEVEMVAFIDAAKKKYADFETDERQRREAILFRLEPH
jgi:hypothetical protein